MTNYPDMWRYINKPYDVNTYDEKLEQAKKKELDRKDKANEEFADFIEEKFHEFYEEKIKGKDAELPHTRLVYTYVKDGLVINHKIKPPKPPRVPSELETAAKNLWDEIQKYRDDPVKDIGRVYNPWF